jgi:uncharacterized protein
MNCTFTRLICIASVVITSGCTSIGSYVISNPNVYLSEAEFIKAKPQDIGFTKHEYCSTKQKLCLNYLTALPYQVEDFPVGGTVYYNLHATGNGVENTISHTMAPESFNRFKGTALLLHGYGGNKEVMLATSIYFRALGMNVIIPDLYGHGESEQPFAFGSREHHLLSQLLNQLADNDEMNELTIVVGHSMGTLAAANLLSVEHIDAGILLAPMMRFDLAAKEYLAIKSPLLNDMFSEHLDDIVAQAMENASVTLEETDLLVNLNKTLKPTLLVNSNIDSVSPPEYFSSIDNEQLTKFIFKNRVHSSLMVFNKEDASKIELWLSEL